MKSKFVGMTIRIILGIVLYLLAVFFFIGEINRIMDMHPVSFSVAYANMKGFSLKELIQVYLSDYKNMLYPVGVLAAFTELPAIIRVFTKGLWGAMKYEMAAGEYDLVNISTGEIVGHGNDGAGNALIRLLAALLCIAVLLPTMLIIKPFILLINFIKWLRMIIFMAKG